MTLYLELFRKELTDECTMGELFVGGKFQCYTLEDPVRRGPKIPGQTAIPAGDYPLVLTYSEKFKRTLPLLESVPGFEGVRIHPGNTVADTEGCILVGEARGPNCLYRSRMAFRSLYDKLWKADKEGREMDIEINEDL